MKELINPKAWYAMLILSRNLRQSVIVGEERGAPGLLIVTVLEIHDRKVKLGFEGDAAIPVHRLEVWQQMMAIDCDLDTNTRQLKTWK